MNVESYNSVLVSVVQQNRQLAFVLNELYRIGFTHKEVSD